MRQAQPTEENSTVETHIHVHVATLGRGTTTVTVEYDSTVAQVLKAAYGDDYELGGRQAFVGTTQVSPQDIMEDNDTVTVIVDKFSAGA
jgi:hypothetical protein